LNEAADHYKNAMDKCEQDPKEQLVLSMIYKKIATNYAIVLEKLGRREEAHALLQKLKANF
jgi:hypothetical protein